MRDTSRRALRRLSLVLAPLRCRLLLRRQREFVRNNAVKLKSILFCPEGGRFGSAQQAFHDDRKRECQLFESDENFESGHLKSKNAKKK